MLAVLSSIVVEKPFSGNSGGKRKIGKYMLLWKWLYDVFACRDGPDDIRCFCVPYTMMNVSETGNFTHRKQVVSQSLIQKLHIKGGTCLLSIINSRIF